MNVKLWEMRELAGLICSSLKTPVCSSVETSVQANETDAGFNIRGKLTVLFLRGKPHFTVFKTCTKNADMALEEWHAIQDYHLSVSK